MKSLKLKLSPKRLHDVMYAMIYPGVLGSFLMMFADKWFQGCFTLSQPVPWLCGFLFVVLFTLDYVYSLGEDIKKNYSGIEFLSDLGIVILIYLAGHAIFNAAAGLTLWIWGFLFFAKFFSTIWEHKSPTGAMRTIGDFTKTDVIICLGFLLGLGLSSIKALSDPAQIGLFSVLLVLDGLLYLASTSET